MKMIIAVKN